MASVTLLCRVLSPLLLVLFVFPNNKQLNFSPEVFVVGVVENHLMFFSKCIINSDMAVSRDLDSINLLFAVEPPSDLKFKILNENTVHMSWRRPSSQIQGYRIQVISDTGA